MATDRRATAEPAQPFVPLSGADGDLDDLHGLDGLDEQVLRVHHDLRNRAAVVSGFASLVAEEALDAPLHVAKAHLGRLLANVAQMDELITSWHGTSVLPATEPGAAADGRDSGGGPAGRRLLVVEGDGDHFEMIRSLLARPSRSGRWDVLHARTLGEACRLLVDEQPACSLVNLKLPDAGALEALVAMRSIAPDHPIVVVTGYAESGVGIEAVRHGAQDYLVKGSLSSEILERSVVYAIERSRIEAELSRQALHDALTGLPNRVLLMDRLRLALARLDRSGARAAVMFIDLDRFKLVNDTMGHHIGDQVLVAVADRLRRLVRRADTVARFGGDEFVVLFEDLVEESEATKLADQLLGLFTDPFPCGDDELRLRASIGVAVGDCPDLNAETVLANADAAMYRAKESGRAHWELFDDSMRSRLVTRLQTERALATAITDDQLTLYYQPLVGVTDGRIAGAEALLRWNHPDGAVLTPSDFLVIAEDSGQIVAIGAWVLEQACAATARWHDAGLVDDSWTTWVNVSSRQLDRPGLLEAVADALTTSGLRPSGLGIEITEGAFIEDAVLAAGLVEPLHRLGVRIAIDDFGTGFSSLRRLRDLPIDRLKIDGSFVRGLDRHAEDATIVTGCVQLARALGLSSVAEAVETPRQLEMLREMGCDLAQGFATAAPMPPRALESLLRETAGVILPPRGVPGPAPSPRTGQ